ncbi:hypothetical protein QFC24_001138 [Naganishia onofrii]|uniref:Uncharacterized protein n=1 Tax=Naganishia onofrii TaxID=1851511 RepID=A0ACC2XSG0_9TREE|nr:hypothetical protein QFC24_001138 [Naganishia onofrii]
MTFVILPTQSRRYYHLTRFRTPVQLADEYYELIDDVGTRITALEEVNDVERGGFMTRISEPEQTILDLEGQMGGSQGMSAGMWKTIDNLQAENDELEEKV